MIENINVTKFEVITKPKELKTSLPINIEVIDRINNYRHTVKNILNGSDKRIIVVCPTISQMCLCLHGPWAVGHTSVSNVCRANVIRTITTRHHTTQTGASACQHLLRLQTCNTQHPAAW